MVHLQEGTDLRLSRSPVCSLQWADLFENANAGKPPIGIEGEPRFREHLRDRAGTRDTYRELSVSQLGMA